MSIETMSIVLHHSKAKGTAKLVLLGIANHDGDDGAWPSLSTLKTYAGVDERNIRKAIRTLEELGELSCDQNAGGTSNVRDDRRPNLYHVLIQCPPDCDRTKNHRPLTGGRNRPAVPGRGDASVRNGGTPASPKPSVEPSPNSTRGVTDGRRAPESQTPPTNLRDLGGLPSQALPRPERCPRHQTDAAPPPCGACADARRTETERRAEAARLEHRQAAIDRQAEIEHRRRLIAHCQLCNDDGYVGTWLCNHDPESAERARRGAAAARAAIVKPRPPEPTGEQAAS